MGGFCKPEMYYYYYYYYCIIITYIDKTIGQSYSGFRMGISKISSRKHSNQWEITLNVCYFLALSSHASETLTFNLFVSSSSSSIKGKITNSSYPWLLSRNKQTSILRTQEQFVTCAYSSLLLLLLLLSLLLTRQIPIAVQSGRVSLTGLGNNWLTGGLTLRTGRIRRWGPFRWMSLPFGWCMGVLKLGVDPEGYPEKKGKKEKSISFISSLRFLFWQIRGQVGREFQSVSLLKEREMYIFNLYWPSGPKATWFCVSQDFSFTLCPYSKED